MSSTSNSSKLPLILTSAAAVTALSYFLYTRFLSSQNASTTTTTTTVHTPKTQQSRQGNPRICEIWVFPIAGCRGFCLNKPNDSWNLVDGGLEFDREFCFAVPDKNDPAVMKKVDTLPVQNEIFVRIEFSDASKKENAVMTVSYKNAKTVLRVPLNTDEGEATSRNTFTMDRYGTVGHVVECGNEIASWFKQQVFADMVNENFGIESDKISYENNKVDQWRLVRVAKLRRPADKKSHQGSGATTTDFVRFQAFGGLHIISKESISWLQSAIPTGTAEADEIACSAPASTASAALHRQQSDAMIINVERFRANLLLENVNFPEEDQWRRVEIKRNSIDDDGADAAERSGDNHNRGSVSATIQLHFAKHTDRCEVPTMHPVTGRRHPNMQPTATIKTFRGAVHPWQRARYEKYLKEVEEKKQSNNNNAEEETLIEIKKPAVKAMFGIEMFHEGNGVVFVGDQIIVKEVEEEDLKFE